MTTQNGICRLKLNVFMIFALNNGHSLLKDNKQLDQESALNKGHAGFIAFKDV